MKHPEKIIKKIIKLKKAGYSSRAIAGKLGIGKTSVNENWNKYLNCPQNRMKILFFDLETAPSIVAVFGRLQQNIGPESVIKEGGFILSACWKFNGDADVTQCTLTPEEARKGDDSRIVGELYEAFENADAVCAHNGNKFDVPVFKTRLIANNMPPPRRVKVIDTLSIAKGLKFNSNKLESLGNYLGVGRKIKTEGMPLWLSCMEGDEESLKTLSDYNRQDVVLLEQVYEKLKAFNQKGPNAGLFFNDGQVHCPVCGSTHLSYTGNKVTTNVSVFEEIQCNSCGHRSRTRQPLNDTCSRKKLLS
jgi:hypothetical protein